MENVILELSQEKSTNVRANADWTTNLSDQDILLEEGDQLSIKNVFLDTVSSSSGKVKIVEPLTLNVGVIQYMTCWQTNSDFVYDPTGSLIPNADNYIKTRFKVLPSPGTGFSGYFKWDELDLQYDGKGGDSWGNFTAHFVYIDIHGVQQNKFFTVPEKNSRQTSQLSFTKIGLIFEANSLVWLNSDVGTINSTAIKPDGLKTTAINEGETAFAPEIETFTMTLPAGDYDPTTLATFLSTEMSIHKQLGASTSDFVKSAFMVDSDQVDTNQLFMRTDGSQTLRIKDSGDPASSGTRYWIGANQIQWVFNESTKRFALNFCHFPLLSSDGKGTISAQYFHIGNDTTQNIETVTTNSGCLIHSLTAQTADGKFTDFWSNTMGFNLSSMLVNVSTEESTDLTTFQPSALTTRVELIPGTNLVNGYIGLDAAVQKTGTAFWKVPTTLPLISTIETTNPIVAERSFQDILLTTSHFLVELNSTFVNNFVNQTVSRGNIQSIVSRYYGYEQFTSSEGAGSITYVHKGEPVYIKSVGCRILQPDLALADIGNRNHIYVEIIKPPRQELPAPAPKNIR